MNAGILRFIEVFAVSWAALVALAHVVIELRRPRKRAEQVIRRLAYPLRRQLNSWLNEWPADDEDLRDYCCRRARQDFDPAERRAEAMLRESGMAGEEVANDVWLATRNFYDATQLLNEIAIVQDHPPGTIKGYLQESGRRFTAIIR